MEGPVNFATFLLALQCTMQGILGAASPYSGTSAARVSSQSCGAIVDGDKGTITYKAGELTQANERCVWVLRSFDHDMINVRLNTQPWAGSVLDVATFTRSPVPLVSTRRLLQPGAQTFHGSVALITFATPNDAAQRQGFTLSYEFLGFPTRNISRNSKTYVNRGQFPRVLDHPLVGEEYENQELSVYVIQPPSGVVSTFPGYLSRVDVLGLHSVNDVVRRYIYSIGVGWSLATAIPTVVGQNIVRFTDLEAYVFTSDDAGTSAGFKLGVFNPEQ